MSLKHPLLSVHSSKRASQGWDPEHVDVTETGPVTRRTPSASASRAPPRGQGRPGPRCSRCRVLGPWQREAQRSALAATPSQVRRRGQGHSTAHVAIAGWAPCCSMAAGGPWSSQDSARQAKPRPACRRTVAHSAPWPGQARLAHLHDQLVARTRRRGPRCGRPRQKGEGEVLERAPWLVAARFERVRCAPPRYNTHWHDTLRVMPGSRATSAKLVRASTPSTRCDKTSPHHQVTLIKSFGTVSAR